MKRNPFFLLQELDGIPYVMPYGQSIASHDRGVRLNESGVFLWNCLSEEPSHDELLSLFVRHYDADEAEIPLLSADLDTFVTTMVRHGAILPDRDPWSISAACYETIKIAGFTMCLEGPKEVFSEMLQPFILSSEDLKFDATKIDMTITAFAGICPYKNPGYLLLRNDMLSIVDTGDYYELQFHANKQLKTLILKKDGHKAIFYYEFPHDDILREELFHGIREAFLYLAGLHGLVAIHSTSILYRGKAWLFSGHSGMGKSTHAALWHETFGTPTLNGDLNLIDARGAVPVIHGIPWCGTSGIFDMETHQLGGIILLKRDSRNHVEELPPSEQILLVDQRLISHSWTEELFLSNLETIKKIAPSILICSLYCTKEPEAAIVMQKRIDQTFQN